MKADTFEPLLNQKFTIKFSEDHQYEFELIEVTRKATIERFGIEPFILYFRGDPSLPIFAQGNYTLLHDKIEPALIFLVPRQPDKEGIYYECSVYISIGKIEYWLSCFYYLLKIISGIFTLNSSVENIIRVM